jgi:hypothetical protein
MWQDYNINRKVRTKKSIIQTFGKILLMAVLLIILGFFFYAANDIQANGPYRPQCAEGYFYSYDEMACLKGYRP